MGRDRDAALIRDCKRGDRQALELLISRYERPIYNAAYRLLGNPDDAADVTQIAFLKAFEHMDRFDPKYKFFSWIYRIAINESIDQLKRRRHQEPMVEQQACKGRGPDELLDSSQLGNCVQMALMELQPDHRSVIVLRHFAGCSYKQIGEILQIPEKTVKSRLYAARQAMKETLKASDIVTT